MTEAGSSIQTSRFDIDGVGLAYDDEGSGDATPLVFIHGWTGNRHRWDHQLEHFKTGRRVIRLDLRGHGESDKPDERYSIDGFAADVLRMLDGLGIERAILVGHSMGGMIAQKLTLAHPEKVERLILVDSVGKMVFNRTRGLGMRILTTMPYKVFVSMNITRGFRRGYPREEVRRYIAASHVTPKHVVMSCWAAMREFDVLDRVGEIKVPVLLVHGYHDVQFPPREAARLAARYRNAVVRVLDVGHEAPVEDPAAVTSAIADFLAR